MHPRLGQQPLHARRVARAYEENGGELAGRQRGGLEDKLVANGLGESLPQSGHDGRVLPAEHQVIPMGPRASAARQEPVKGPDEVEQAGGLGSLLLETLALRLDPLDRAVHPPELSHPARERRGDLRRCGSRDQVQPLRQTVDIAEEFAKASRLP